MTTQEMLKQRSSDLPDEEELQLLLSCKGMCHDLYGRHIPTVDSYPEPEPSHWECTCSACGQVFAVPDDRRLKDITVCPECDAAVMPRRWMNARSRKPVNDFLFYHVIRGRGRAIWVRSWQVRQWLTAENMEIDYAPMSIYYFDDGICQKWKNKWNGWQEIKTIKDDVWYKGTYTQESYPSFVGAITEETLQDSCLEYSQLDRAIHYALPIIAYLRMYTRYPAIEYIWKTGCERLLVDHLCYRDGYIRQAVNLRAKDFKALFRGADRQEMKIFPQLTAKEIVWFHELYRLGVIHANQEGVDWMRIRMNFHREMGAAEEEAALHRYIKRQAKRSGLSDRSCLGDYADYLHQLEEIGGGEPYPRDLQEAHRRLSARLRKTKNKDLQGMFRARRKLWSWAAWRYQGMLIRPIDSVDEITLEGEQQDNCVASYAGRHASGRTAIFVLRKTTAPKTNWHTVELDPKTLRVKQCRGYHNAEAAPEAKAFIKAWMQYLQEQKGREIA